MKDWAAADRRSLKLICAGGVDGGRIGHDERAAVDVDRARSDRYCCRPGSAFRGPVLVSPPVETSDELIVKPDGS